MPRRKAEITELLALTTLGLRLKYAEVLGETARSKNKGYLARRIARRLQEMAHEAEAAASVRPAEGTGGSPTQPEADEATP